MPIFRRNTAAIFGAFCAIIISEQISKSNHRIIMCEAIEAIKANREAFGGIMHISYNPNPEGARVGDCVVRAISKAIKKDWATTYLAIALQGYIMRDMPSANRVWGAYLRSLGYKQRHIECENPDSYTVADFAKDNPIGTYILALSGHVVCVCDGDWYDTWDCCGEIPIYYWAEDDNV